MRLTVRMREDILAAATEGSRPYQRLRELEVTEKQIAKDILKQGGMDISTVTEKINELICQIPVNLQSGAVPWKTSDSVLYQGRKYRHGESARACPYYEVKHPVSEELGSRMYEYVQEKEAVGTDLASFRRDVRSLLQSVPTVESLKKAWPEVEKFLPHQPEVLTNPPAVQITKINSYLL